MSVSQTAFTQAMLDPSAVPPAGLTNPDGAPATKRFNVYRNNVAVSLTEALETAFPVICKLIGAENFKAISGLYLRQHPPTSPLMMFYGADMPAFLARFVPLKHVPYLADVARLELALRHAYHAADSSPINADLLPSLSAERLMAARFGFAPAVHLLRSHYPIHAIWAFNMVERAPAPTGGGQNVLVTRPDYDPEMHVLPPGGGTFVSALMRGEPFATALDKTQAQVEDFDLTTTLGLLLAGAAITRLTED